MMCIEMVQKLKVV
jgi:hypothetical protein